MKNAFVTFATQNYFDLLEITVKSLKEFSKYPIIVYGINCNVKFSKSYDNVILRRLDAQFIGGEIFYEKFNILINAIENENLENGIYIESDDIATPFIDNLFEKCKDVTNHPLCPIHPQSVEIINNQIDLMSLLHVEKPTQPYVHAHMVFNKSCLEFFKECYSISKRLQFNPVSWDESLLNVMIWKNNLNNYYLDVYDPYFEIFENRIMNKNENYGNQYYHGKIYYYMIHGCKSPSRSENILNFLKSNKLESEFQIFNRE